MYQSTDAFFNVEGTWGLSWTLRTLKCSYGTGVDGAVGVGRTKETTVTIFTTKSGAPQPDLIAGADTGSCAQRDNRTFTSMGVMDDDWKTVSDNTSCAILSPPLPSPPPNPCAVKVDPAVASSISAALTATAYGNVHPVISCPPTKNTAGLVGKFWVRRKGPPDNDFRRALNFLYSHRIILLSLLVSYSGLF